MMGICPMCCLEPCRCGDAMLGSGNQDSSAERAQTTQQERSAKDNSLELQVSQLQEENQARQQEIESTHDRMTALLLRAESAEALAASLKEENQRLREERTLHDGEPVVNIRYSRFVELESAEALAVREKRFSELIATELDHYAQKVAKRVLSKALSGKMTGAVSID